MRFRKILDYVYPPRCPLCDAVSEQGICGACLKKVVYIRDDYCMKCGKPLSGERQEYCGNCKKNVRHFDRGRALFVYRDPVRPSLYRLKYGNRREYAAVYGAEMAAHLGSWIRRMGITKIVPVPLHPSRQRRRGYNQAALLARELGRVLALPVDESLLFRVKRTLPQKKLTGQERKKNLADAFAVRGRLRRGERILLVDDIYTTGATADAAARCLKDAEECRVFILCVAAGASAG